MELQLLLVLLGAAATSLLVAAVLGKFWPSIAGTSRLGSLAGVLALLIAAVIGSRIGTEQWPAWPPVQARAWWVFVVAAGAAVWLVVSAATGQRWAGPAAALAGAAAAVTIVMGPLAGALGRMDSAGAAWWWRIGLAAALGTAAWASQRATGGTRGDRVATGRPGPLARLRDDHAATVGLGLVFGLGAMGVLFTASSITLGMLMLAVAAAWGGLAITAWLIRPGLNLGGAAVVASVGYAAVWVIAHFFGQESHAWVLAIALGGPVVVWVMSRRSQRGGWPGWAATVTASMIASLVIPATFGPAYVRTIPNSGETSHP